MRATEAFRYQHGSTGNYGPFFLNGGIYQFSAVGLTSGSVQLFQLGADDATWISVGDPITANGGDTIYLSAGEYRWTVTSEADVSLVIARVPGE